MGGGERHAEEEGEKDTKKRTVCFQQPLRR